MTPPWLSASCIPPRIPYNRPQIGPLQMFAPSSLPWGDTPLQWCVVYFFSAERVPSHAFSSSGCAFFAVFPLSLHSSVVICGAEHAWNLAQVSMNALGDKVAEFLLTAAAIGILFKTNASISGAEGIIVAFLGCGIRGCVHLLTLLSSFSVPNPLSWLSGRSGCGSLHGSRRANGSARWYPHASGKCG